MSPRENQCRPRRSWGWHWFSRGDNFPCYSLVQSIIILLYWMLFKYITSFIISLVSKLSRTNEYLSSYSVNSNVHAAPVRIYGKLYAYVWFQNNPGQVKIWVCISYSVNSNVHTTLIRIYGEPYAHKFCAAVVEQ